MTSVGDLTINTLTSTAGRIDLTATAGSIIDGNGTANNITAGADSTLRALGGVIGLSADPIEVNINPGTLGVEASGQIAGVSIDINGIVLPANTLTLLNPAPGNVIFNGVVLNPPTPPVNNAPNFTWVISNVSPAQMNEDGPFIELIAVDKAQLETEPCQIALTANEKGNIVACLEKEENKIIFEDMTGNGVAPFAAAIPSRSRSFQNQAALEEFSGQIEVLRGGDNL